VYGRRVDEACLYDWVGKDGEKAVSVDNFYGLFINWCAKNGEKGSWSQDKDYTRAEE
jgi:hypothetical protein